jgi:HEAT repeat protein
MNMPQFIDQIQNGDDIARRKAWKVLSWHGEAAVPTLIELLTHAKHEVRHAAVLALGRIASPLAIEPLYNVLRHEPQIYTRGKAILALCKSAGEAMLLDLLNLLDNHERGPYYQDKRLCEYAADCLIKLGAWLTLEDWALAQLSREDVRDKARGILYLRDSLGCEKI